MHGGRRSSGGEANHVLEGANSLDIRVAKDGHGARALGLVALCTATPLDTPVSKFVSKKFLLLFVSHTISPQRGMATGCSS